MELRAFPKVGGTFSTPWGAGEVMEWIPLDKTPWAPCGFTVRVAAGFVGYCGAPHIELRDGWPYTGRFELADCQA